MKKWMLMIAAFCAIFIATQLYAATDLFYLRNSSKPDSTWADPGTEHYRIFLCDTATIYVTGSDTIINLGAIYNNFFIRSLNGAADSAYVQVNFGGAKGIWHNDSVARNLTSVTVGKLSSDSTLVAPIGAQYIFLRPFTNSTSLDSTILIEIKAFR